MKIFFKSFIFISILFVSGCTNPPGRDGTNEELGPPEEPSPKKDAIFRQAYEEHGDSGSCAGDRGCEEICDDIYKHRSHKTQCENKLPLRQVELLEEIFDMLKKPDREELKTINPDDLRVLLSIAVEPIVTLANRRSQADIREILTWLAENKKFVEIFKKADRNFEILKALLTRIDPDPDSALSAPIYKGNNFIEIAVKKKNHRVIDWVHDFFDEDCGTVNNYTECLFKEHYCNLRLNSRSENYYFTYEPFYELLEKTLEDARPLTPPPWWPENVDIDNVDSWLNGPHNVCEVAEFK